MLWFLGSERGMTINVNIVYASDVMRTEYER